DPGRARYRQARSDDQESLRIRHPGLRLHPAASAGVGLGRLEKGEIDPACGQPGTALLGHETGIAVLSNSRSRKVQLPGLVPTFRSSCYTSAPTFHELRKVMGTSKLMILVPLFHLKFLIGICRLWRRNFKWAALVVSASVVSASQGK